MLALTGFANESLKRLITVVRVAENQELAKLLLKDKWEEVEKLEILKEWGDSKLENLVKKNEFFRKGLVNLFLKVQPFHF